MSMAATKGGKLALLSRHLLKPSFWGQPAPCNHVDAMPEHFSDPNTRYSGERTAEIKHSEHVFLKTREEQKCKSDCEPNGLA
jgi:hypothetical protein